ncbi:NADH-quinone oxidoreductase subunit B family protein [Williamwhitmania taraxaci]|uniref:Ni,Fe-hydrogenase III small subunit n=1 Tax=Williamwhitmania taraxaci TaxID=1640674 RepID=A0A1G6MT93_9BACT|nr:NADH:ubiquinone oxidoreductase [Williamwhitmania taraxaci]SDC58437.1 Ni,Fe-hydrogenase III small subunit [Williamwhitmania taraxaci]
MLNNIKILYHQGKQFIPDVTTAKVPGIFRGRPVISLEKVNETELVEMCPMNAITANPVTLDLGKCNFCGECAMAFPSKITFTTDYKISSNERERLIIKEGDENPVEVNPSTVRKEIHRLFGSSLKLRQVSAGGDGSCEWELNASNNVQFDMGRFGIEFVASPRHADGIVITGPISKNMAEAVQICYDAIPDPKIIVLVGTDAISGGAFAGSEALDRSFLDRYPVDLYIPGNPAHPLTIINGLLDLTRKR